MEIKHRITIILLFTIIILFRIIYLYQEYHNNKVFTITITATDTSTIIDWATRISDGDILGSGTYHQTPVYPYLVGLIFAIFGKNQLAVIIFQNIIGLISIYFLYLLIKKYTNKYIGYLGILIYGLYDAVLFYDSVIMRTSITTSMIIIVLYYSDRLICNAETLKIYPFDTPGRNGIRFIVLGILNGILLLIRPNVIFFTLSLFILIFYKFRKKMLYYAIGIIIILGMLFLRNTYVGAPIFKITSRGPDSIIVGNHRESTGIGYQYIKETQKILKKSDNNLLKIYWNTINTHVTLWSFIRQQLFKLLHVFNWFELPNNYNIYFYKEYSGILRYTPFNPRIVLSLSLFGLLLCFYRIKRYRIFYILFGSITLFILGTYMIGRFRQPLIPVFIIFLCLGIYESVRLIKKKKRFIFIIISVLLLSGIFVNAETGQYIHFKKLLYRDYTNMAYTLGNQGKYDLAIIFFKKALDSKSDYKKAIEGMAISLYNYALLKLQKDDWETAERALIESIKYSRLNPGVYKNLGYINQKYKKDYQKAIMMYDYYLKCSAISPKDRNMVIKEMEELRKLIK